MNYSVQQSIAKNSLAELHTLSDMELISQVRDGVVEAFEPLMRRYNQRLYRLSRSFCQDDADAMDILQDSYVKAYEKIEQFRGPEGFAGWISRIIRNEALMRIRRNMIVDIQEIKEDQAVELKQKGPLTILAQQQLAKILENAIDQLPPGYAEVYVQRGVQQLSTAETAQILALETDVVKTRYSRAKKMLRKGLEQQFKAAGMDVFEFAGNRCDAVVRNVLKRISGI